MTIWCFSSFWNHIDGKIYEVAGRGDSKEEAYENMTSLNNCGKYQDVTFEIEE